MLATLWKGLCLGLAIAAPMGPIGILVLKRSVERGCAAGLASGFGVAFADLIYGLLAVAGVRLAPGHSRIMAAIGGVFLLGLAWKFWRDAPASRASSGIGGGAFRSAATTFLLTLSNPITILSFAAMVASTGAGAPVYFVAGVFLGSMLWWTILSATASSFGALIDPRGPWLGRLAAVTLACFGAWAIWTRALPKPTAPHGSSMTIDPR